MRIKVGACLLLFFAVLCAQAAEEPAVAVGDTPQTAAEPSHLTADAPSLATQSDPDYRNVLVGGVSLGASYDTAGYSGTNGTTGDTRFFAQPSVAFRQTYPTANWTLSYTPGVSVSQHATDSTQFTHNLAGDVFWKATPRWTLHARQDYSISTNPFENVGRVALLPDLGGYFGPNYDGVIAYSKRTAYISNADISYRLTPHVAVGITGGYQQFDYGSIDAAQLAAANLIDSTVVNGSLYVSDQISKKQTLGVQFAYVDIYSTGAQRSRVQAPALLLFDTVRFTTHSILTVYAGPEYARSSAVVPASISQHDWHPSAGVTYAWAGTQNALTLEFSRRISSGSGLMSANIMTFGSAAFRSRITKRWTAEARLSVDNQDQLGLFNQDLYFRTTWAGGSLARELNRHCSIRLDGAYINQTGTGLGSVPGNHGLIQITFDVHFRKGLGR